MIDISHHDSEDSLSDQQKLYKALDTSLRQSAFGGSAAQAHGIATGLACRSTGIEELATVSEHLSFTDSTSLLALESLLEMSARDLNQTEFGFDLWLPDVEELGAQLEALAEWSQGYIIGLMHDGVQIRTQLNAELDESIQDVIEIAGLENSGETSSEDEVAFMELREYLRMVAQLTYEELYTEQAEDPAEE